MAQTNNAGELVRQGRLNTGAAQVLQGPQSDPLGAFYKARDYGIDPNAATKQKAAENKALDTMLDFDPEKGWSILENEITEGVAAFRKGEIKLGDWTSNEGKVRRKNAYDQYNLTARYQQDLKDRFFKARTQAKDINQKYEYYDWDKYARELQGNLTYTDKNGATRPRPTFSINAESFDKAGSNPDNFNQLKVWQEAIKAFPEQTNSFMEKHGDKYMLEQEKQDFKGRNMMIKGGLIQLKDGMPIIDMDINDPDDEAKQVLMENDWVKAIVDQGRAQGKSEAEIWKTPMELFRKSIDKEIGKTDRSFAPQHYYDRGNANFNTEVSDFVKRPHNVINESGEKTMIDTNIMRVVTLGGKFMDKKVDISSGGAYNIGEGKVDEGWVGSRKMSIMELQYVPWNNDPRGKKGKQLEYTEEEPVGPPTEEGEMPKGRSAGHVVHLSQEEFNRKQLTNKYYGGRWMAQAQYLDEDLNKHEYLIPYDQVRGKIREMTKTAKTPGYDLLNTPLYQRSDNEIIDYLKKKYDYKIFGDQLLKLLMGIKENEIP